MLLASAGILVLVLVSCSKEFIDAPKLYGTWYEMSDDTDNDTGGTVTYVFKMGGLYEFHTYDALSGKETADKGTWTWGDVEYGDNVLCLHEKVTDAMPDMWKVTRLNSNEMEWQRVRTTAFNRNQESDCKHFKRAKE